jgi:hypothetical protein
MEAKLTDDGIMARGVPEVEGSTLPDGVGDGVQQRKGAFQPTSRSKKLQ